ncbi:MAG: cytochrome c oxidase subunit II [Methyloligellaceae bacterium]
MTTAFPGYRWIATVVAAFFGLTTSLLINPALAGTDKPYEWKMGMQKAVTAVADEMADFHTLLLVIITVIVIFVALLLIWVMVAYNEKSNPTPSKTSHNTLIEVAWTVVPILILVIIAIPSFRLLKHQYTYPKSDVVIKATGYQWQWGYEYPDTGIDFISRILEDDEIKKAKAAGEDVRRLLSVDNPIVVPVNKVVHVYLYSNDVLHNWTIPQFGVKMDAIPGSAKLVWFKAREEGTYYGQCSEMCGARHAFMPIEVRVVSDDVYAKWLAAVKADPVKAKALLVKAALDLKNKKKAKSVAALTK